jgi:hypothetical protein
MRYATAATCLPVCDPRRSFVLRGQQAGSRLCQRAAFQGLRTGAD